MTNVRLLSFDALLGQSAAALTSRLLWVRDHLGLSRNHYDRFAHCAFGFFLAFPIRELLLRFSGANRAWSFWLPAAVIRRTRFKHVLFGCMEPPPTSAPIDHGGQSATA